MVLSLLCQLHFAPILIFALDLSSSVLAVPAIHVALQASFNSAPYLLELLLVTLPEQLACDGILTYFSVTEKLLLKKTRLPTSPCLIVLPKDIFWTALPTKSYTRHLFNSYRMTDTSQAQRLFRLYNLPCLYTRPPRGSRRIISTTTPRSNLH